MRLTVWVMMVFFVVTSVSAVVSVEETSSGSNILSIKSGATEKMRIDSTSYTFNGLQSCLQLTTDASGKIICSTTAAQGTMPNLQQVTDVGATTTKNVKIGATGTPQAPLHVEGSTVSNTKVILGQKNSEAPGTLNPGYYVWGPSELVAYGMKLQYTNGEYGTMMFGPNQANRFLGFGKVGAALEDDDMVEYMRVDLDNGNMGIGTPGPEGKLSVAGDVGIGAIANTDQANHMLDIASTKGSTGFSAVRAMYPGGGGLSGTEFAALAHRDGEWKAVYAKSGTGGAIALYTDGEVNMMNGNVGIGTPSPGSKLDVAGTIRIRNGNSISFERDLAQTEFSTLINATNWPSVNFNQPGENYWLGLHSKGGTHIVLNTDGGINAIENPTDHFVIWQGGVDGTKLFDISNAGNTYVKGVVTASSFTGAGTGLSGTAAGLTAGKASSLAVNGANCLVGNYPLGVDASGAAEGCTAIGTPLDASYLQGRSISSADSADETGVTTYYLPVTATNKPTGTDHSLLTLSYSNLWSTQLAGDWRTNDWYTRGQSNGAWSSWAKLWHQNNDGTGSGLDADTSGRLITSDTRSTNPSPQSYSMGITSNFKQNGVSSDGLTDGGTYHGVLTFRQWSSASDWSGGGVRQLGFTDNHNLWIRGANADTTWSSWSKIWHQNNDGTGSTLDADLLDGKNADTAQTGNTIALRDASGVITSSNIKPTAVSTCTGANQKIIIGSDGKLACGTDASASASGWVDDRTNVRLTTATDSVSIGATSVDTGLKLDVNGNVGATQYCDSAGTNCFTPGETRTAIDSVNSQNALTILHSQSCDVTFSSGQYDITQFGYLDYRCKISAIVDTQKDGIYFIRFSPVSTLGQNPDRTLIYRCPVQYKPGAYFDRNGNYLENIMVEGGLFCETSFFGNPISGRPLFPIFLYSVSKKSLYFTTSELTANGQPYMSQEFVGQIQLMFTGTIQ